MRVAVMYLARWAEGIEPFQRFADSYKRHPAGFEHELIVLYKGCEDEANLAAAKAVFAGIPHTAMLLPDTGLDIGSYLAATERIDHDAVCYLNTFSEICTDNWLRHLHQHLAQDSVGIVGATGSYESLYSSWRLLNHVIWITSEDRVPFSQSIYDHFHHVLDYHSPAWCAKRHRKDTRPFLKRVIKKYKRQRKLRRLLPLLAKETEPRWLGYVKSGEVFAQAANFPPFPNPHIRSNAFMVRRTHMMEAARPITDKTVACFFESGADGLTWMLRNKRLRAVVVDRNGRGFDVPDWAKSRTFRRQGQEDLLIRDNQTKAYDKMSQAAKDAHTLMSWGDYVGKGKAMPTLELSIPFPRNPKVTW